MSSVTDEPTTPRVGATAPDFELPSTNGEKTRLSTFRGERHVLLAFFPLAFTSVCSAEMTGFYEDVERFEQTQTKVLGISCDSVPVLSEFQFKLGIKTEMLSDHKREVSRLYGVLDEETFFARRSYFLIDRQGILRWSHVEKDIDDRRDNQELHDEIEKLSP